MATQTDRGQIVIELVLCALILFVLFMTSFSLTQTALFENARHRFAKPGERP